MRRLPLVFSLLVALSACSQPAAKAPGRPSAVAGVEPTPAPATDVPTVTAAPATSGQQTPPPALGGAPSQAPVTSLERADLVGVVLVPQGYRARIVAEPAAAFRLGTLAEAALGATSVWLADARGVRLPAAPAVRTEPTGHFVLPAVSLGATYMVVAAVTGPDGAAGELAALARPERPAAVSAASTIVTFGALPAGHTGVFDPLDLSDYDAAVDLAREKLARSDLPSLGDRAAVVGLAAKLAREEGALGTRLRRVMDALTQARRGLAGVPDH